jgi:hypothetical protein
MSTESTWRTRSTAMMSAPSCASRMAWLRPWPCRAGDEGDLSLLRIAWPTDRHQHPDRHRCQHYSKRRFAMDGSTTAIIIIPIVTTISLALGIFTVY